MRMKPIYTAILRTVLFLWLVILSAWFAAHAYATTPRGVKAPAEFRRIVPCPATGLLTGACDGWVMDHICPLECNCPDAATNLQWQSKSEGLAKDRWEGQCWRYNRTLMNPLPPAKSLQPPMTKGK